MLKDAVVCTLFDAGGAVPAVQAQPLFNAGRQTIVTVEPFHEDHAAATRDRGLLILRLKAFCAQATLQLFKHSNIFMFRMKVLAFDPAVAKGSIRPLESLDLFRGRRKEIAFLRQIVRA